MPLKTCPKCGKGNGPRTFECNCGHVFIDKSVSVEPKKEEGPRYLTGLTVYTPAGDCPFKLKDAEPENVLDWARRIQEWYAERGNRITKSGILYYSREFFDIFTPEYKAIKEILYYEQRQEFAMEDCGET